MNAFTSEILRAPSTLVRSLAKLLTTSSQGRSQSKRSGGAQGGYRWVRNPYCRRGL